MKMFNGLRKRWDKWLMFDLRPPQEFYHPREWGSGSLASHARWQLVNFETMIEEWAWSMRRFYDVSLDTLIPAFREFNATMTKYRRAMLLNGIGRYWPAEPLARWLAMHWPERWL